MIFVFLKRWRSHIYDNTHGYISFTTICLIWIFLTATIMVVPHAHRLAGLRPSKAEHSLVIRVPLLVDAVASAHLGPLHIVHAHAHSHATVAHARTHSHATKAHPRAHVHAITTAHAGSPTRAHFFFRAHP